MIKYFNKYRKVEVKMAGCLKNTTNKKDLYCDFFSQNFFSLLDQRGQVGIYLS